MIEMYLAAGFVLATVVAVTSGGLFYRCLGTKLAGDFLACIILGFSGEGDDANLRILCLVIVSVVTLICFLMGVVGGAHARTEKSEP